jgi:hypothetical protein
MLNSLSLSAGLVTCATSMLASQSGSTAPYESQVDAECHHLQTRLPLLRADLESIMATIVDNETALKSLVHEANWEWKLRDALFVSESCFFESPAWIMQSDSPCASLAESFPQFVPKLCFRGCKRTQASQQFDTEVHHAPRTVMNEELERWVTMCVTIRRIATVRRWGCDFGKETAVLVTCTADPYGNGAQTVSGCADGQVSRHNRRWDVELFASSRRSHAERQGRVASLRHSSFFTFSSLCWLCV